jgi:hypothetical protein
MRIGQFIEEASIIPLGIIDEFGTGQPSEATQDTIQKQPLPTCAKLSAEVVDG